MRKNITIEERTQAIQKGVRDALRESALLGHSVCIWRDGGVVWLTPDEILKTINHTAPPSLNGTSSEHHE